MLTLFTGARDIIFPRRGDTRRVSWRYLFWLIILPTLGIIGWYLLDTHTPLALKDPGIVAASFGVLGGLLFAHAIFVFQLRVSYDAAGREPEASSTQRDLRVRPLIDEMFNGVLYASLIALLLTMLTAFLAATLPAACTVPPIVAALIGGLALHLLGGVLHVVSATTTAYSVLKSQGR